MKKRGWFTILDFTLTWEHFVQPYSLITSIPTMKVSLLSPGHLISWGKSGHLLIIIEILASWRSYFWVETLEGPIHMFCRYIPCWSCVSLRLCILIQSFQLGLCSNIITPVLGGEYDFVPRGWFLRNGLMRSRVEDLTKAFWWTGDDKCAVLPRSNQPQMSVHKTHHRHGIM